MRAFGGKLTSLNLVLGLSLVALSSACSDDTTNNDDGETSDPTDTTDPSESTTTSEGDGDGDSGDGDSETVGDGDGDGGDGDGEMTLPDDAERNWYHWTQSDDDTRVNDVAAVSDGVLVAHRRPHSSGELGTEGVLTKYDTAGDMVWEQIVDSQVPCNQNCSSTQNIVVTDSGDIVVAGAYRSDTTLRVDAMITTFASDGTPGWQTEWSGTQEDGLDEYNGAAVDPADGSIYAVGNWENDNLRDAMLHKYDSSGTFLWEVVVDGAATASSDNLTSVAVASNGDVLISGRVEAAGLEGADQMLTARYDSDGNELWTDLHDEIASLFDGGVYIEGDANGNAFTLGTVDSGNLERHDIRMALYDANGNVTWEHKYDGPVTGDCETQSFVCDLANDGQILADGNYVVAGAVHAEKTDRGGFVGIFDSSGSFLWERMVEGEVDYRDSLTAVSMADDGTLYVGGFMARDNGMDGAHTDFFLASYSPSY